GGTHDSVAYKSSDLAEKIAADLLPKEYYVIGDDAYEASSQFLTPWPGRRLSPEKDSFNYHLSQMRQVVERSFGMLTKRFSIFWRPFIFALKHWRTVIRVCCKLHNLCIDSNVSLPDLTR